MEALATVPFTCMIASFRIAMNLWRFRGGLVFKAHRILYHSTLGLRVVIKKKNKKQ